MDNVKMRVGKQIRHYRQGNGLTLDALAKAIHKSKATVSKYELGEIAIDVETLIEISRVLHITPSELLQVEKDDSYDSQEAGLFSHREYLYYYDGRTKRISRSAMDYFHTNTKNSMRVTLFYDVPSFQEVGKCRNLYIGHMTQYAFVSNYTFTNQKNSVEQVFLYSVESLDLSQKKTGVLSGLSSHSMTPMSIKVQLFRSQQKENDDLLQTLLLTKEDLKLTKRYNILTLDRLA